MQWKFTGSAPVYQQIAQTVRDAVLSGEFGPGDRVPSVRDLASQARVNPNTVQRAFAELEQEGLLVCGGTLGRCVTLDPGILDALKQKAIQSAVLASAEQFRALGVPLGEAAAMLAQLEDKEESEWTRS